MTKKISKLKGVSLIDYGYLKPYNQSTLQSVIKHRKNNHKIWERQILLMLILNYYEFFQKQNEN